MVDISDLKTVLFLFKLRFKWFARWKHMLPGTIISTLISFLTNIVFWLIILDNIPSFSDNVVGNWSDGEILVLISCAQISGGISLALFMGVTEISNYVNEYGMESTLVRPINPILNIIATNFYPFGLINSIMGVLLLIISLIIYQINFSIIGFLIAILIIILANTTIYIIYGIVSTLGFWLGKLGKIEELIDKGATTFDQIPTTILPNTLFVLFTFAIPVFFLSTYPAILITKPEHWGEFLFPLILLPVTTIILGYSLKILFQKGLKRYKSIGG